MSKYTFTPKTPSCLVDPIGLIYNGVLIGFIEREYFDQVLSELQEKELNQNIFQENKENQMKDGSWCNFSDLPEEYAQEVEAGNMTIDEAYILWKGTGEETT